MNNETAIINQFRNLPVHEHCFLKSAEVIFSDAVIPEEGSIVYILCESMICPEERQCGPDDVPLAMCCEESEYCDRTTPAAPVCLPRPD